ncbi:hypothetical protein BACSTE_00829 [Bacteroides stercoris ATCC 43183]|uniref:Uncharacterized protein n=1 Tax=Bacteroides stercoris ATCC 43183 TaxID=449673 RepID=B0NMZ9_BACSE|nr:hypothetical protein BACSTE_00829 [Bacteroides stercoris ATCC 43183]
MKKDTPIDFITPGICSRFPWSFFENAGGYKRKLLTFGLQT